LSDHTIFTAGHSPRSLKIAPLFVPGPGAHRNTAEWLATFSTLLKLSKRPAKPMQASEPSAESILRIELLLCPGAVASVALLVADCCVARLQDAEASRRLHLAAFELVENAVKYSSGRRATIELELERGSDSERWLTLRVRNDADPERLDDIGRRFRDLRHRSDPVGLYDRLIVEAAPKPSGFSGLGLARIRAEGGLELDCMVDGSSLTISARARLAGEGLGPGASRSDQATGGHAPEQRRGTDR
jgi:hypothetical protein